MALNNMEAEYMALYTCGSRRDVFLQKLQVETGMDHEGLGVLLLCDNQSSKKIAQIPIFHKRSKHIAIWYHYIWEKVESVGIR